MFKNSNTLVLLMLLFFGCETSDQINLKLAKEKSKEALYEVICKHPMGYTLKFTVNERSWRNLHYSRNSNWFFKDITGTLVRTSVPCYTDSSMRIQ